MEKGKSIKNWSVEKLFEEKIYCEKRTGINHYIGRSERSNLMKT